MQVVALAAIRGENEPKNLDWRKRLALQIVIQLPENAADAIKVLDYARDALTLI